MKQKLTPHRRAVALLLAATALPFTPALAQSAPLQDPPVVNVPPPTVTAPAPPPPVMTPAPPPAVAPAPPPVAAPAPPPPSATRSAPAEPPAARTTRSTSSAVRRAPRSAQPRAEQAARQAAATPAATPAPAETAPTPAPTTEPVAPVAQAPVATVPAPGPVEGQTPAFSQWNLATLWPWLLAGALLVIGAILLFGRRRRAEEDVVHEDYPAEPTFTARREEIREAPRATAGPDLAYLTPAAAAAAAATPIAASRFEETNADTTAAPDRVSVGEPASADVEALAAASEPEAGRPWIEFLMRPLRAGTTGDDAVVEFELTVGNTGSVPAKDVRISTWMFAAGSAQESEMERMLIDPPAEARVSEVTIEPGDGTRVEAALALPKTGLQEAVLPVVVADARYRLPDGTEGRTSATFEVGLPGEDDALDPFPVDRTSGLIESVEARLHGDLERV